MTNTTLEITNKNTLNDNILYSINNSFVNIFDIIENIDIMKTNKTDLKQYLDIFCKNVEFINNIDSKDIRQNIPRLDSKCLVLFNMDVGGLINYILQKSSFIYNVDNLSSYLTKFNYILSDYNIQKMLSLYIKSYNNNIIYDRCFFDIILKYFSFKDFDELIMNDYIIIKDVFDYNRVYEIYLNYSGNINQLLKYVEYFNNKIGINPKYTYTILQKIVDVMLNSCIDIINIDEKYNDIIEYSYIRLFENNNINYLINLLTRHNKINYLKFLNFFKNIFDEKTEKKYLRKLKNKNFYDLELINYILENYKCKYSNNKDYIYNILMLKKLNQ